MDIYNPKYGAGCLSRVWQSRLPVTEYQIQLSSIVSGWGGGSINRVGLTIHNCYSIINFHFCFISGNVYGLVHIGIDCILQGFPAPFAWEIKLCYLCNWCPFLTYETCECTGQFLPTWYILVDAISGLSSFLFIEEASCSLIPIRIQPPAAKNLICLVRSGSILRIRSAVPHNRSFQTR